MMDTQFIGYTTTPTRVLIDAWRVKLFCQAIGETSPVYWDAEAAHAAGHKACPVPPTFLKAMESDHCNSAVLLTLLKVPLHKVLHAEQHFDYAQLVWVGTWVEISRSITELYEKRAGALSFIVIQTRYKVGELEAASSVQTIMVRNHTWNPS